MRSGLKFISRAMASSRTSYRTKTLRSLTRRYLFRPRTSSCTGRNNLINLLKCAPTDTSKCMFFWYFMLCSIITLCIRKGYCLKTSCEVGKRKRYYNVLSGSVLSVWTNMERVLSKSQSSKDGRLQVIRLRTSSNKRIVGVLVNPTIMDTLMQTLNSGSANNPLPSNAATSRAHPSSSTPDLSHSSANSWGQANGCDWR